MQNSNFKPKATKGFTLPELLVVITIIVVLSTVILGNRSQYTNRLSLNKEAYNLVIFIRQAQIYSLGVKGAGSPISFGIPYGISVSNYQSGKSRFFYFTDNNKNGLYDSGEELETVIYSNSIVARKICAMSASSGGTLVCNQGQYNSDDPARVDITFLRPDPSAVFKILNKDNTTVSPTLYPPVNIILELPDGSQRTVVADATGQIGIQ